MPVLRVLVMLASAIQLAIGSYAAYRLLWIEVPDVFGLLLCSAIVVTGLASLSALYIRPRPSVSRISTMRMNLLIFSLLGIGAILFMYFERHEPTTIERLHYLLTAFAICASPFLVNCFSLGLIERKVQRLAWSA
jgi:cytochrome bd-type quinol oxidase subunit 1